MLDFQAAQPTKAVIQPFVEAVHESLRIPYLVDPSFVLEGERRWHLDGPGALDPETGRYSASMDEDSDQATVSCQIWRNDVLLAEAISTVTVIPSPGEEDSWQTLTSFNFTAPAFLNTPETALYANGHQQMELHIDPQPVGEALIAPQELETIRVFDLLTHQEVAVLPVDPGDNPVLKDESIHWATARLPNRYKAASSGQPILQRAGAAPVERYLHSLATSDNSRKFYAGLRDKYGFWHYSNSHTRNNTVFVKAHQRSLRYHEDVRRISGFNIEPTPGGDSNIYHYNYETLEYWIFSIANFKARELNYIGENKSMIRWERDSANVRFCSFTGVIVGKDDQRKILYDKDALQNMGIPDKHFLAGDIAIDDDQIAVTNHRIMDTYYRQGEEEQGLAGPILLELIDEYGSTVRIEVKYGSKGESNHRNLLYAAFKTS